MPRRWNPGKRPPPPARLRPGAQVPGLPLRVLQHERWGWAAEEGMGLARDAVPSLISRLSGRGDGPSPVGHDLPHQIDLDDAPGVAGAVDRRIDRRPVE